MRKKHFTLTELLTVIAIIAILASLGAGGLIVARKKASETRAKTDCNSLKMALQQYLKDHSTFRKLASCADVTAEDDGGDSKWYKFTTDNDAVMKVLTGDPDSADRAKNPRKIKYLESRVSGDEPWVWLDPWKQPYVVLIVAPGKSKVQDPYDTTKYLNGEVFVYSCGVDATALSDDDVKSW